MNERKREWKDEPDNRLSNLVYRTFEQLENPNNLECTYCGEEATHIYFHRHADHRGGVWYWCSKCLTYGHGSAIVPEWWVNNDEIQLNKLHQDPNHLQDKVKLIEEHWKSVLEGLLEYEMIVERRIIETKVKLLSLRLMRKYGKAPDRVKELINQIEVSKADRLIVKGFQFTTANYYEESTGLLLGAISEPELLSMEPNFMKGNLSQVLKTSIIAAEKLGLKTHPTEPNSDHLTFNAELGSFSARFHATKTGFVEFSVRDSEKEGLPEWRVLDIAEKYYDSGSMAKRVVNFLKDFHLRASSTVEN